jgi:hypothetical protein
VFVTLSGLALGFLTITVSGSGNSGKFSLYLLLIIKDTYPAFACLPHAGQTGLWQMPLAGIISLVFHVVGNKTGYE